MRSNDDREDEDNVDMEKVIAIFKMILSLSIDSIYGDWFEVYGDTVSEVMNVSELNVLDALLNREVANIRLYAGFPTAFIYDPREDDE